MFGGRQRHWVDNVEHLWQCLLPLVFKIYHSKTFQTTKRQSCAFRLVSALATICFPGYKKYSTDVSKAVLPQQVFLDTNATVKTLETAGNLYMSSNSIVFSSP